METNKKIYFASDFHLGAPDYATSLEREKRIVKWLDEIKDDAEEIFLVGDLFDFWFEYKTVVPRGYVRILGKIAELTDSGIPVHLFTGNHDMWIFDYLPKEINIILHKEPIEREFGGKKFLIGHGDGLGPGDNGYKFLKKVFANKFCQWLFAIIHPDLGMKIANYWSHRSRIFNEAHEEKFLGESKEWLVIYCKEVLQKKHYEYFIFGHRHLPLDIKLNEGSRYINLGEWFKSNSFAVFDGTDISLKKY
jgi:UDP-2,3-diacylglucosamine hydrolase